MGPIGMQEMIFIVILALLLFGPKKLPELARLLGKGMSEFRRAKNELKSTFDTHLQELERETRMDDARRSTSLSSSSSYSPYASTADEYGRTPDHDYHHESSTPYPTEPPVKAHFDEISPATESPSLTPATIVAGTVPRGTPIPIPDHEHVNEEHPA